MDNKTATTDLTVERLRAMTDDRVRDLAVRYPKPSQWTDKRSFEHVLAIICLQKGKEYLRTGRTAVFFR